MGNGHSVLPHDPLDSTVTSADVSGAVTLVELEEKVEKSLEKVIVDCFYFGIELTSIFFNTQKNWC